jgi:hypothetical protein
MATDAKTGQPIFGGGHGAGLRSVGSYQVSGHPFITGSAGLGQNECHLIEFPYVSKSVTVINKDATYDIRAHFQSGSTAAADAGQSFAIADTDDIIAGRHFVTVPAGDGSVTFDVKCSKLYVSQNAVASDLTYEVYAELTGILAGSMYHLTGSGITDTEG